MPCGKGKQIGVEAINQKDSVNGNNIRKKWD
jgi:hypothetical protein